jgi:hypothetical protein
MREILFRGKRKDTGEWVYGSYVCRKENRVECHHFIYEYISYTREREVKPETVGEYTGFNDSRGVKIYEDDIINVKGDKTYRGHIVFRWLEWCISNCGPYTLSLYNQAVDCKKEVVLIGNIHDSPELLEETTCP